MVGQSTMRFIGADGSEPNDESARKVHSSEQAVVSLAIGPTQAMQLALFEAATTVRRPTLSAECGFWLRIVHHMSHVTATTKFRTLRHW